MNRAAPKPLGLSIAGTDLVACTLVGIALGVLTNKWFPGSKPWGFLACLLLGIAAGFWQLLKHGGAASQGKKP